MLKLSDVDKFEEGVKEIIAIAEEGIALRQSINALFSPTVLRSRGVSEDAPTPQPIARRASTSKTISRTRQILDALKASSHPMHASEIITHIGGPWTRADSSRVKKLHARGLIEKTGDRRTTRWSAVADRQPLPTETQTTRTTSGSPRVAAILNFLQENRAIFTGGGIAHGLDGPNAVWTRTDTQRIMALRMKGLVQKHGRFGWSVPGVTQPTTRPQPQPTSQMTTTARPQVPRAAMLRTKASAVSQDATTTKMLRTGQILGALRSKNGMPCTGREIAQMIGGEWGRTERRYVNDLCARGLAVRLGNTRNVKWKARIV